MNTLLVGLDQEEERRLIAALERYPQFHVAFKCSSYEQALQISASGTVEFTFISTRISDMSYHDFALKRQDQGWTAFFVAKPTVQSKLSLLAAEGYSAGRMAGFVSPSRLEPDLADLVRNISA